MSLSKSSLLFSLGTFFSRIFGLVRDQVLAYSFGASVVMDAFTIAYRIPNLFREMLAEGALANAFTKVYSEWAIKDEATAKRLLNESLLRFMAFGIAFALVGIFLAEDLVGLMTLHAEPTAELATFKELATAMTKILFPFLTIMIVGSISMGALHQKGNFFVSSVSSISLNVGFILGALLFGKWVFVGFQPGITETYASGVGLAFGVLLGGGMHVGWQLLYLRRDIDFGALLTSAGRGFKVSDEFKKVLVIMIPASLAASSGPINQFVNTNFATSLGPGVVSWLYYAMNLFRLPVGIFGVAVGVAALPALTAAITRQQNVSHPEVYDALRGGTSLVLWLTLPCSVFLFFTSHQAITLLYFQGSFDMEDVHQTARALQAYALGIGCYGLMKMLTSFYFAVERTSYALLAAFICVMVNFTANYFLVETFGHVGLAITSVVTLSANALILWLGMAKSGISLPRVFDRACVLYLLAASAAAVALCQVVLSLPLAEWLAGYTSIAKLSALVELIVYGVVIFGSFLVMACIRYKSSPLAFVGKLKNRKKR